MPGKTKIEWATDSWNPVTGCTKVSPGCDNCYAERITERFHGKGSFEKIVLRPERLDQPLRWKKPRMVFVNSMSDLFHGDIPDKFIHQVFAAMALAPRHEFQVLTKRPRRMMQLLNDDTFCRRVSEVCADPPYSRDHESLDLDFSWPLPNVWLGVSVEDQKRADLRIPLLLETPAAVRFLSCEPLLGPISLSQAWPQVAFDGSSRLWVIVGGESGPGARPMHPHWARELRGQCIAAEVPFFFKQWGEWAPARDDQSPSVLIWPEGFSRPYIDGEGLTPPGWTHMARYGKKRAGRELDGRTWDEMPSAKVGAAS